MPTAMSVWAMCSRTTPGLLFQRHPPHGGGHRLRGLTIVGTRDALLVALHECMQEVNTIVKRLAYAGRLVDKPICGVTGPRAAPRPSSWADASRSNASSSTRGRSFPSRCIPTVRSTGWCSGALRKWSTERKRIFTQKTSSPTRPWQRPQAEKPRHHTIGPHRDTVRLQPRRGRYRQVFRCVRVGRHKLNEHRQISLPSYPRLRPRHIRALKARTPLRRPSSCRCRRSHSHSR